MELIYSKVTLADVEIIQKQLDEAEAAFNGQALRPAMRRHAYIRLLKKKAPAVLVATLLFVGAVAALTPVSPISKLIIMCAGIVASVFVVALLDSLPDASDDAMTAKLRTMPKYQKTYNCIDTIKSQLAEVERICKIQDDVAETYSTYGDEADKISLSIDPVNASLSLQAEEIVKQYAVYKHTIPAKSVTYDIPKSFMKKAVNKNGSCIDFSYLDKEMHEIYLLAETLKGKAPVTEITKVS